MISTERLAIQRVKTVHAPDERVAPLEVDVRRERREDREEPTEIVLSGTVGTERIRRTVVDEVRRVSTASSVRDELSILEGTGEIRTTDRRALPVRGETDDDAEQVTQALYGAELTAYDRRDGWRRVRTPGGYLGWVDASALTDAIGDDPDEWTANAVVGARRDDGVGESEIPAGTVPAGVDCRLESRDGDEVTVSFRTGARATFSATDVRETTPVGTGEDVVAAARGFLETPYEWGGMTLEGIDCSGLVWVAYAAVGVRLPRDADQQGTMGADVDRDDLAPGDLLFFPGHVAISLGGSEYIHASGSAEEVTINSLDPDDDGYVEGLDEKLSGTKRLLEG